MRERAHFIRRTENVRRMMRRKNKLKFEFRDAANARALGRHIGGENVRGLAKFASGRLQ